MWSTNRKKNTSLIEEFVSKNEIVIFAHDEENDTYHLVTKLCPPHNIRDTSDRLLYGSVEKIYEKIHKSFNFIRRITVHLKELIWASYFKEREIGEIQLVGVCTDICIFHTAIDAIIYKKGVASFNTNGHDWALNHFKNTLGATVTNF